MSDDAVLEGTDSQDAAAAVQLALRDLTQRLADEGVLQIDDAPRPIWQGLPTSLSWRPPQRPKSARERWRQHGSGFYHPSMRAAVEKRRRPGTAGLDGRLDDFCCNRTGETESAAGGGTELASRPMSPQGPEHEGSQASLSLSESHCDSRGAIGDACSAISGRAASDPASWEGLPSIPEPSPIMPLYEDDISRAADFCGERARGCVTAAMKVLVHQRAERSAGKRRQKFLYAGQHASSPCSSALPQALATQEHAAEGTISKDDKSAHESPAAPAPPRRPLSPMGEPREPIYVASLQPPKPLRKSGEMKAVAPSRVPAYFLDRLQRAERQLMSSEIVRDDSGKLQQLKRDAQRFTKNMMGKLAQRRNWQDEQKPPAEVLQSSGVKEVFAQVQTEVRKGTDEEDQAADNWQTFKAARALSLDAASYMEAKKIFERMDADGDGEISFEELEKAILEAVSRWQESAANKLRLSDLCAELWRENPRARELDTADFGTFLSIFADWRFMRHSGVDDEDMQAQYLSRRYKIKYGEMKEIKQTFAYYAGGSEAQICQESFRAILYKLMRVPPGALPEARLLRFWRELDKDGSEAACFEEFVDWWVSCSKVVSPYEDFYKGFRKIAVKPNPPEDATGQPNSPKKTARRASWKGTAKKSAYKGGFWGICGPELAHLRDSNGVVDFERQDS
eukprot:TRINITY_DN110673_c0_g1_i1.p1 TRINITY_DN110673_c0_g1~~TRINITY_DN110673_c0_g1_i1.p1  ORF type:complete len:680 (+),score=179.23 TRINITY_DN110673_c0_g1_i1:75-2114(+)